MNIDATHKPGLPGRRAPWTPLADVQRSAWGQRTSTPQGTLSYGLGRWAGGGLQGMARHRYWGDSAPWKGAAQFGTAGALGGAGLSWLYNQFAPMLGTPEVPVAGASAVSGLLGALLGGYRAHNMSKQGDTLPFMVHQAMQNAGLPGGLMMQVQRAWGTFSPQDRQNFLSLLGTTTGALLGAAVMRFLAGRTIAIGGGALIGGYLGNRFAAGFGSKPQPQALPFWTI